jgi:hypothetical protein
MDKQFIVFPLDFVTILTLLEKDLGNVSTIITWQYIFYHIFGDINAVFTILKVFKARYLIYFTV